MIKLIGIIFLLTSLNVTTAEQLIVAQKKSTYSRPVDSFYECNTD